ncbi:hypothetical protein QFZ86_003118 [Pseudomonas plecoglossicida]
MPVAQAQSRHYQVASDAKMLALMAQEALGTFVDKGPIDTPLLQTTKLDHFVIDAIEQLILGVEGARRVSIIQRGHQGLEVEWGKLLHQRHASRCCTI